MSPVQRRASGIASAIYFTGWMQAFLSSNQQCQSTEGKQQVYSSNNRSLPNFIQIGRHLGELRLVIEDSHAYRASPSIIIIIIIIIMRPTCCHGRIPLSMCLRLCRRNNLSAIFLALQLTELWLSPTLAHLSNLPHFEPHRHHTVEIGCLRCPYPPVAFV